MSSNNTISPFNFSLNTKDPLVHTIHFLDPINVLALFQLVEILICITNFFESVNNCPQKLDRVNQPLKKAFTNLRLQLHGEIYRPDSFVLMLRYCANLKAIRHESTSLKRIVVDKSRVYLQLYKQNS